MVDSIDGKKNVGKLTGTSNVSTTNEVGSTSQTSAVGKTSGVKEVGKVTAINTDNIDRIQSMVSELSSQMFKNLSPEKRDIIERAVKMALEASKPE